MLIFIDLYYVKEMITCVYVMLSFTFETHSMMSRYYSSVGCYGYIWCVTRGNCTLTIQSPFVK